jgi:preprotein translocase subunit YajC
VPDDASSLTETDEPAADASSGPADDKVDLAKKDADAATDAKADEAEPKKTDGDSDAK